MTDVSGFLKKLSPTIFVGFQERYMRVTDGGQCLAYYKNGPPPGAKDPIEDPRGIINLGAIYDIKILNGTDFSLISTERDYTLRAPSPSEKDKWLAALNLLIEKIRQKRSKEDEQNKEKFTNILQNMVNKPSTVDSITSAFTGVTRPNQKIDGTQNHVSVLKKVHRVDVVEQKKLKQALTKAAGSLLQAMNHVLTGSTVDVTDNNKKKLLVLVSSIGVGTDNPYTYTLAGAWNDNSGNNIQLNHLHVFSNPNAALDPLNDAVSIMKLDDIPDIDETNQGFELRLEANGKPLTLLFAVREEAEVWKRAIKLIHMMEPQK